MKHRHLLVNSTFDSIPFKTTAFTADWIRGIVKKIGMEMLYAPRAVMCDKKGNEGISAFCLITTSHISLHTWDQVSPNSLQLDVYSCKNFDINLVLDELKLFNPISLKYKFLDRDNFDENLL